MLFDSMNSIIFSYTLDKEDSIDIGRKSEISTAFGTLFIGTILAVFQIRGNSLMCMNSLRMCVNGEHINSAIGFKKRTGIASGPVEQSFLRLRNSFITSLYVTQRSVNLLTLSFGRVSMNAFVSVGDIGSLPTVRDAVAAKNEFSESGFIVFLLGGGCKILCMIFQTSLEFEDDNDFR